MNKNKKTAFQSLRKKKNQQKIISYLDDQTKASQTYCQTLQEYLYSYDIDVCFNQLHLYLDKSMLVEVKRNIYLQDGVYILLEGNITYVWTKNKHDRDRKDHLFSLAKVGVFSNLNPGNNQVERENTLSNGYSLIINNCFAVVESDLGNICTNQESTLLKIPQNVLQLTSFYRLKQQRTSLFSKIKLPGAKNFFHQSLVNFNLNLHHTFRSRKYYFRNKFSIQSLGVIVQGSVNVKSFKGHKKIQFSKYCILISKFQYQVSSAEVLIIETVKNPTIIFKKPAILQTFIQEINNRISFEDQNQKSQLMNKYRNKISNSISISKSRSDKYQNKNENKKNKKQFSLFSKQCQNYCIVSMQLCQENLHRIKKLNKQVLKTEKRNKKPHILFNFSKKEGGSTCGNKQNLSENSSRNVQLKNQSVSCHKENLMERYSIYAKDMYQEYKRQMKQGRLERIS